MVATLATKLEFLVAKEKMLVALATVLVTISSPAKVLLMALKGKVCRDWRPLIRSWCKCVVKKYCEWKAALWCVT